jgi:hypothetical protein
MKTLPSSLSLVYERVTRSPGPTIRGLALREQVGRAGACAWIFALQLSLPPGPVAVMVTVSVPFINTVSLPFFGIDALPIEGLVARTLVVSPVTFQPKVTLPPVDGMNAGSAVSMVHRGG